MTRTSAAAYCDTVLNAHHTLRTLQWLKRDLRLVDRCATPWVVLGMHRPMYVVYPHKSNRRVGGEGCAARQSVHCRPCLTFVSVQF
jgi:hypothetical protein